MPTPDSFLQRSGIKDLCWLRCTTAKPVRGAKRQGLLKHVKEASERAVGTLATWPALR